MILRLRLGVLDPGEPGEEALLGVDVDQRDAELRGRPRPPARPRSCASGRGRRRRRSAARRSPGGRAAPRPRSRRRRRARRSPGRRRPGRGSARPARRSPSAATTARSQPATSRRKRVEDLGPVRRVDDLGVELDAVEAALGRLAGGDRGAGARGERGEPLAAARRRRRGGSSSSCCSSGRPAEQATAAVAARTRSVRPNSPASAPLDPAAERLDHRLHPVTDAQHRDLRARAARVGKRRRPRLVDRGRPAGEHQRPRARAPGSARRGVSCGSSSAKTPHSRIRRAISCEYCPPKSRTSTSSRATCRRVAP